MSRPSFIAHWRDIERPEADHYSGSDEAMAFDAPFSENFGLSRIGIHHVRLLPGRRTSYPHAESTEEEFVYVISGAPEVWIDGVVHRLREGDGVVFVPGTGITHTFMNNSDREVRLLVVGERPRADNRIHYALHPDRNQMRTDHWSDWPGSLQGDHDGLPDLLRDGPNRSSR